MNWKYYENYWMTLHATWIEFDSIFKIRCTLLKKNWKSAHDYDVWKIIIKNHRSKKDTFKCPSLFRNALNRFQFETT
jgi:hypothetical protein